MVLKLFSECIAYSFSMPSPLSGVCVAAVAAVFWQSDDLRYRAAECAAGAAANWFAPVEPESVPTRTTTPSPVVVVRRPLVGLPAHRQFLHDFSASEGWHLELALLALVISLFVFGCVFGFCCRRCLELPELVVRNGGRSARADARGVDRRALRG